MKKKYLFILLLIFTGCVNPNYDGLFDTNNINQKAINYTQKGGLFNELETKAIITATYLNKVDDKFNDADTFLVGIFIDDDFDDDKIGLKNPLYKLEMNNKNYLSIEDVDKNDILLKTMPLVNRWAKYYIVKFSISKDINLKLQFSHKAFGTTILKFKK